MKYALGFTLLELLIVLAITTIVGGIALPSYQSMLESNRSSAHIQQFIRTLNLARHTAITKKEITTLCPSNDGEQCGGDWHRGTILFRDKNNNRKVDSDERLIEVSESYPKGITLNWRASAGRNTFIRFSPSGAAREFGTFTYCPRSRDTRHAKMLVLNRQGRVHNARDVDGDGIAEKRNGDEPEC
ncbi:MAG: GspH/FimT family pseudopilin [Pseudomonadales bacterium]